MFLLVHVITARKQIAVRNPEIVVLISEQTKIDRGAASRVSRPFLAGLGSRLGAGLALEVGLSLQPCLDLINTSGSY